MPIHGRQCSQTADTAAGNAQNTGHRGPNNSASWPTSTATTSAHLLSELGDLFAFLSLSGKQMVVEWCVQQGVDDVAELFDCEFAAVLATSLDLSDTDRTRLVALLGPHSPEPTPTGSASSNSNAGAQAPPHADESSPEGGASSSLIASAQAPTDEGGSRQEVVASSSANAEKCCSSRVDIYRPAGCAAGSSNLARGVAHQSRNSNKSMGCELQTVAIETLRASGDSAGHPVPKDPTALTPPPHYLPTPFPYSGHFLWGDGSKLRALQQPGV
eukprot:scaffold19093_cov139-Isochrysis_galbana.AAC.3